MAYVKNLLAVVYVWLLQAVTLTATDQARQLTIISLLREYSNPNVIPVPNNGTLQVGIEMSLIKIIEVDNYSNEIEVVLGRGMSWIDRILAWKNYRTLSDETSIILPTKYLWVPDIIVYNAISSTEDLTPSLAHISSNGQVFFQSTIRVRITCDLQNLTSNNGANCAIKLGSWTRSADVLSISNPAADLNLSPYAPNPRYEILSTSSKKNSKTFPCCPEVYEDIDFQFTIRRRSQSLPISE